MSVKVIINADDFGYSREVNEAIILCFKNRLINQTTLMVNMPYAEDAVELARESGFIDKVGIHLNLIEGQPLSGDMEKSQFCDSEGRMNDTLISNLRKRLYLTAFEKRVVRNEIEAQIKKYMSFHLPMMHMDSHRHVHNNISIFEILLPLLSSYEFRSIRLARNIPQKDMRGIKKHYKTYLNDKILKYNKDNGTNTENVVTRFGSQRDFLFNAIVSDDTYELMSHPMMKDGVLSDSVNFESVENFVKKNGLKHYESFFEFPFCH